jgi:hypothetical protein
MDKDDDKAPRIRGIVFGIGDFSPQPEHMAAAQVDFGPGFDEFFEASVQLARETKEEAVVNGPDDLPVMASVVTDSGSVMLPIQEMCDHTGLRPPEALQVNLQISHAMTGTPIAVLVLLETVYRKYDDETHEMLAHRPGELSERWAQGESGIGEALVVTIATPDRYASEFMPYHYGDGSIVWDEGMRTEIEGWPNVELQERVAEAIQVAFRQQEGEGDGTG